MGGCIRFSSGAVNCAVSGCNFISNTANAGGVIYWYFSNGTISNCNYINNHANQGDNIYWYWTVEDFLNNYGQINDYDYLLIRNGVGTPSKTIVLNKKGITISSEGRVTFDARGGNLHFEVTGDNILIEKITFRNFNFTTDGGAIQWTGNNGKLKSCNFINNTAAHDGGAVCWNGTYGSIINCVFTENVAHGGGGVFWAGTYGSLTGSNFIKNNSTVDGGAVYWRGKEGNLTSSIFNSNTATQNGGGVYFRITATNTSIAESTFISNTAYRGGGLYKYDEGTVFNSIFTNNFATQDGGGVYWTGTNGNLTGCNFSDNSAGWGGGVYWTGTNGIVSDSTFNNNTAINGAGVLWSGTNGTLITSIFMDNTAINHGGAIYWYVVGYMANCSFVNSGSHLDNGIDVRNNLNINGGNGIVYIVVNGNLSGASIVVLNNETYYYPPDTNINLCRKMSKYIEELNQCVWENL